MVNLHPLTSHIRPMPIAKLYPQNGERIVTIFCDVNSPSVPVDISAFHASTCPIKVTGRIMFSGCPSGCVCVRGRASARRHSRPTCHRFFVYFITAQRLRLRIARGTCCRYVRPSVCLSVCHVYAVYYSNTSNRSLVFEYYSVNSNRCN